MAAHSSESLVARIAALQDYKRYEDLHWEGSFEDYLDIVRVLDDRGLIDEHLQPYFRDVEDHTRHTVDHVEHLRDRIDGLLQADLTEQGNVLNDVTRKLAAWAAIIAVPTALTGYFGQNLPFPGYERHWGFLLSISLITVSATALYIFLRRRGWL